MRILDKDVSLQLARKSPCTRRAAGPSFSASLFRSVVFLTLAAGAAWRPALAVEKAAHLDVSAGSPAARAPAGQRPKRADFAQEQASTEARYLANWVVDSGDNQRLPFAIVDKTGAKVFVFQADGSLLGAAPALLGLAIGDDAVPGIGERKLSSIRPDERTTPAGRFVASMARNLHGAGILWVDYEGAISMHAVITSNPKEQRAARLATPTPLDNRISFGCINVPSDFFKNVVSRVFTGTFGVVYVLPETRPLSQVFASYDVEERDRIAALGKGSTQSADPRAASDLTRR